VSPDPDPARRLLYRLMAENRHHARLSEDRRIVISAAVLLAATIILITLVVFPPSLRTLPLALWLALLGSIASVMCLKLYERAQFHERRARHLRARLIELTPGSGADDAQTGAEAEQLRQFPRLAALRLNTLLVTLNIAVALLGLLYAVLALLHE
jgi:multisubunit Na+/H+ antiporter MnhF subunit